MRPLRLPRALAFTVLHGAVAGALACSSQSGGEVDASARDARPEVDASGDAVASDGPLDCGDAGLTYCGPAGPDASCPGNTCGFTCPAGCEPFV